MFCSMKCSADECLRMIKCSPLKLFALPVVLLISALIIRLCGNGTYTLYLALDGRGFFPGQAVYTVFYTLRIVLSGLSLSCALFCSGLFEKRVKTAALTAVSCILLLFEYKLIFSSMSIFLEILICIAIIGCQILAALAFLRARSCCVIVSAVFLIFQLILLIQLFSLIVSL